MSLSGPVVMAQVLDEESRAKNNNQELHLRSLTKSFCGIEKPLKNARSIASLPDLIQELHRVFDQDRVNIEYVNHIMLSYKSDPSEWKKFAKFDRFRYTRNLVDSGNGKFNLMILCWGSGHASAIHDHADSHCFMKMLNGQLAEVRYDWPKGNGSAAVEDGEIFRDLPEATDTEEQEELKEISRTTLEQNDVAYINDTLGLHRVENPDHSNVAVSLHLYCPPFDACHVFSKTGKQTKAKVTFWSVNGVRAKEAKD